MGVISNASWIGWTALVYTAVMSSLVANSGLYYLLQRYPVSQVAPYSLLSPIFAVIGGILLLQDQLTWGMVIGGIMILGGVGWIHFRTKTLSEKQDPASV